MNASREMPQYRSHKKVWALKIKAIECGRTDGEGPGSTIHPAEDGYAPFCVDEKYMSKHNPVEGGYYVVYDDGYKSFSPASAFESGYTRI